jgi:hypothetical protein
MKKLYRFGATTLVVLAGLAAIGASALIVVTAVVIGGLIALAAKLAMSGASNGQVDNSQEDDIAFEERVPA